MKTNIICLQNGNYAKYVGLIEGKYFKCKSLRFQIFLRNGKSFYLDFANIMIKYALPDIIRNLNFTAKEVLEMFKTKEEIYQENAYNIMNFLGNPLDVDEWINDTYKYKQELLEQINFITKDTCKINRLKDFHTIKCECGATYENPVVYCRNGCGKITTPVAGKI